MSVSSEPFVIPVIGIGVLLVVDLLLQAGLRRTAVPSVVVHLALGFVVALAEWRWGWLGAPGRAVIDFLGSVGSSSCCSAWAWRATSPSSSRTCAARASSGSPT